MDYINRQKIRSKTGKTIDEISIANVMTGRITSEDIKISKETLIVQGEIAEKEDRIQLKNNFERASELTEVLDGILLKIYDKLRPYRCTKQELINIAYELKHKYRAEKCAELVFEAIEVYEKRGLFIE
jgi:propanediol dehydratase small subunit